MDEPNLVSGGRACIQVVLGTVLMFEPAVDHTLQEKTVQQLTATSVSLGPATPVMQKNAFLRHPAQTTIHYLHLSNSKNKNNNLI